MGQDSISHIIGKTPFMKLEAVSQDAGAEVYVKYEASNPGASIKDRAALSMIDRAEERGQIVEGKSILIEPTSGNTGIAIAMIAAARGYRAIICMPESMSRERRILLAAYGAELVLTPASEGIAGAVKRAQEIEAETPDSWLVGQFDNPDNPLAHEKETGPEIHQALGFAPDYVIAGVGTGGTISGIAHYFKKQKAETCFFAVEPKESPLITQALNHEKLQAAAHGIQGIGPNFIAKTLDLSILDGAIAVSTEEALEEARMLAKQEGLLVGISSGANIAAVKHLLANHPEARGKAVVSILVDTGERYLSTELFEGMA